MVSLKQWQYTDLGQKQSSDWHEALDNGDVHLWHLDTADVSHLIDYHCGLLDCNELDRLPWLRTADMQHEFIASHGALRHLLACYTGIQPMHITLISTEFGKPYLASPSEPALHFSLSHSRGRIICAFSKREVGVDVEALAPEMITPDLAQMSLTHVERRMLESLSRELGEVRAFFTLWTLKESYIKATGQGFSADLQSISVSRQPDSQGYAVKVSKSGDQTQWRPHSIDVGPDHAAAFTIAVP